MSLPALIEIVPLAGPVAATVTVPGSKSITNRALILGALGTGATTLRGALWSEDTEIMVNALKALGFKVELQPEPNENCNRLITIHGQGGMIPNAATVAQPLELFVANAGTAARFLAAFLCLGRGVYRLHGTPRMHERPQAPLFHALRDLGYLIETQNDKLPVVIHGSGPRTGSCRVDISESSQFASALMLCAATGGWQVSVMGESTEESPYVQMTEKLLGSFRRGSSDFDIEPDASSGSYFVAADWLINRLGISGPGNVSPGVKVMGWPDSGWQVDDHFAAVLNRKLAGQGGSNVERQTISRSLELGDSIMTAVVLAPFASAPLRFVDLGRLRLQECERVVALRTELTKCGARVSEVGDTLDVFPGMLHGAEIETYDDHRMAMCFALLGLRVPGLKLRNPSCVRKTFPNFFQKLAGPPPGGLGATILDGHTGRKLGWQELFAD